MQRHQRQLHALGSDILLTIVDNNTPHNLNNVFENLVQIIEKFEKQFSRFLPESELTHFNQQAGEEVTITKEFQDLLTTAKKFAENTTGLYNPFILPALQRAGYIGSWPSPLKAKPGTTYTKLKVGILEEIVIVDGWAKIPIGTALDFGGIGKGYLLDRLSYELEAQQLTNYWLSLGGDIICSGFDINNEAWKIGIVHALDESKIINYFLNIDGKRLAIATSGITKRKGLYQGKAWHHLIDPHTGQPAQTDILTATVTAQQAIVADVYAKCVVIVGSIRAAEFIKAKNIQQFLLQVTDIKDTLRIVESETQQQ